MRKLLKWATIDHTYRPKKLEMAFRTKNINSILVPLVIQIDGFLV